MPGRGKDKKPRKERPSIPVEDRIWPRVNKDGPIPDYRPDLGPCWIWSGAIASKGYGYIGAGRRRNGLLLVHRLAYELLVGAIPDGTEIDHLCRVPACCNPKHLEPVTHAENMRRGFRHTGKCRNGHTFNPDTAYIYKGWQCCRTCIREAGARTRQRIRAQSQSA